MGPLFVPVVPRSLEPVWQLSGRLLVPVGPNSLGLPGTGVNVVPILASAKCQCMLNGSTRVYLEPKFASQLSESLLGRGGKVASSIHYLKPTVEVRYLAFADVFSDWGG